MKKYLGLGVALIVFSSLAQVASAAVLYSQTITLPAGWSVVSTPRVLDSHSFSTDETSANFDIYILDASKTSGWATMADLGQTEFAPLYGYFIDNKTGSTQTLTLNYKSDVAPNDRLFSRTFSATGWYSFGVANATYATAAGTTTADTDNPSHILSALSSNYSTAVDLTDGAYADDQNSVAVADSWKATTASDVNTLHDLRETKGYAVFVTAASALYNGFQNNSLPECMDGIDNDSDSNTDYPADTSCASAFGNDESVTPPVIAAISVAKADSVASQNLTVNVPNQPLGGFTTSITGEAIVVPHSNFYVATSSTGTGLLSNVSLIDENGAVVAGPTDATYDAASGKQKIAFNDTVTFPTGTHTYSLKGKLPTSFTSNGTVVASTNPASDWSGATGQTSGSSVSLAGTSLVTMNTMTVKTASLTISMSSSPAAQNIIAGVSSFTFANVQLDASDSGEDVRVASLKLSFVGNASDLSTCQLWDGSTVLNSGSNVVNSVSASSANTFTLDNTLTISKDTVKTLAVKCNVSAGASNGNTYKFGVDSSYTYNATGVTSGNSITPSVTTGFGSLMTLAQGALTASVDASSPSYAIAAGGTTNMTIGVVKFHATNESISITKLGLKLTSGAAADVSQVHIYDGSTQVGTAVFTGSNTTATSTFSSSAIVSSGSDKLLTIKADLADIGTGQPGIEGDLIQIDPLNFQGTGQSSGTTMQGTATGNVAGVRLLNTYPTFALDTLPSTGNADGRLMRVRITANSSSDLGIYKLAFTIATTSETVSNIQLFGFTDSSYSNPVSGQGSGGQIGSAVSGADSGVAFSITPTSDPVEIPAGTTYYFELRGTVSGVGSGSANATTLVGDSSFDGMKAAASVSGNLVWSPNGTSVSTFSTTDWTNGYGVAGLPAVGISQVRTQ